MSARRSSTKPIPTEVDGRGGPDLARRRALLAEAGRPSVLDGFHVLSDHTGGFAVTDTNNYRDPFDRMLIAQAKTESMRLLTADQALAVYGEPVTVI